MDPADAFAPATIDHIMARPIHVRSLNSHTPALPNLDLLRSVAVVLVVLGHTLLSKGVERWGSWYMGDIGLFGVYLFFVHTSLVLMWSLERRPNTLDFYIRRAFRLYPLAIVAIVFAAVTHAPVAGVANNYFHTGQATLSGVIINCLFLQDTIFHRGIIHGVTWSLGPELFMYVLLPSLFFYAVAVRRIWPFVSIWVLIVLLAYRMVPISSGNVFPVLIPDFLAGVIAYIGFQQPRRMLPSWTLPLVLILMFVIYMSLHRIRADWYICLALGLLLPSIEQVRGRVIKKTSHALATYSYGIYLFHPFTIVLGVYILRTQHFSLQLVAIILPLAIVSLLGYRFIEHPMIRVGAEVAARLAHEHVSTAEPSFDALEPAP